nr:hypothetical protein CFP56_23945 [Quercus suber]
MWQYAPAQEAQPAAGYTVHKTYWSSNSSTGLRISGTLVGPGYLHLETRIATMARHGRVAIPCTHGRVSFYSTSVSHVLAVHRPQYADRVC